MTGLVLEGGTLRGIFSAGVMDAFLDAGIYFPYIVGVSAGISNAVSYVSKQFGRNIAILESYRRDHRYLGLRNIISDKSIFGTDFVFGTIPNELIPFDYNTFHKYSGKIYSGVTNAVTGKEEFYDLMNDDCNWQYLRASCAIPGYFPAMKIEGRDYFDGGIVSPIPVSKALKDGCTRVIIVLTQPEGYVKKCGKGNVVMSQLIKHKYPQLEMALLARHRIYNKQTAFCRELEKRGKAIIIRPPHKLESFESDTATLKESWQLGYDAAMDRINEIKQFIGEQPEVYNTELR